MKTNFFKSIFPFAAVAVLGISGAFFTTSMQSAKDVIEIDGYISEDAPCDTFVKKCSNENTPLCTVNGQQLFNRFDCIEALHEPLN